MDDGLVYVVLGNGTHSSQGSFLQIEKFHSREIKSQDLSVTFALERLNFGRVKSGISMSLKTADSPATVTDSKEEEQKQPLYEASTQFRNWRFSPGGLAHIREKLNKAAVAAIRHTFDLDQVISNDICYGYLEFIP